MVDLITSKVHEYPSFEDYDTENTAAAEEEVVSFWYVSSIQSLKASLPTTENVKSKSEVSAVANEPSRFQKMRSWLWGIITWETPKIESPEARESNAIGEVSSKSLSHFPKLETPDPISNERLSKAIAELNKDLLHRLKDTAEFEAELRKSNSKTMDRLILMHVIAKSLDQKKLKEEAGLGFHENILRLQRENKELHKKHFRLLDDINAATKTNSMLHWVNLGTTVGVVGTMAAGFATGGTNVVFALAMPALNILKGGLTATESVIKYKNDLKMGEMVTLNHDVRTNRNNINDHANTKLPTLDEEMSHLLKAIRHHLQNYDKEARVNLQN